jgi:hypothetical protein
VKKQSTKKKEIRFDIRTGMISQQMSSQNFLNDLNEIAEASSFNPMTMAGDYSHAASSKNIRPAQKAPTLSRKMSRESGRDSVAESEYKYIPNNFKMKEGVAF